MEISFETNTSKYVFYWTEMNAVCVHSETDWLFGLIKLILLESSHHPLPPGEIRERLERRCQHHWKAEEVKESTCSCLVSVSGLMLSLLLYLLCVDGVQDEWDFCWLNFHDLNKWQHHHVKSLFTYTWRKISLLQPVFDFFNLHWLAVLNSKLVQHGNTSSQMIKQIVYWVQFWNRG